MFPIMTEEQLKAADEATLRQRVRELRNASAVLYQIRDRQQEIRNCLLVVVDILRKIETSLRKPPRRKSKGRKKG